MKLSALKNHLLPLQVGFPVKYQDKKDLALVYSVWSHREYVTILYYSILSQLAFTDIDQYSIHVFVDRDIEIYARKTLFNLVPQGNIIGVNRWECAKHMIPLNSWLSGYRTIVISDADNLIQTNVPNFYRQIDIQHQVQEQVMFLHSLDTPRDIYMQRIALAGADSEKKMGEMYPYLSKYIHSFPYAKWYLGGFMSYNNSLINQDYIKHFNSLGIGKTWCDESSWMEYCLKHSIPMTTFHGDGGCWFIEQDNLGVLLEPRKNRFSYAFLIHPFMGSKENIDIQAAVLSYSMHKFLHKYGEATE